jgi:hypothetical protein
MRLDREEVDPLGTFEVLEHRAKTLVGETRPRSHAEPGEFEHRVRFLPGQEVAELVRADQEERIGPVAVPQQVDRPRVPVEADVLVRERGARELEPGFRIDVDALVPGSGSDQDDEVRQLEMRLRRLRERDVTEMRRVERASVEGGGVQPYSQSRVSPPTSTSSPFRAPAAFSAASSSSESGGLPETRKPRSVR